MDIISATGPYWVPRSVFYFHLKHQTDWLFQILANRLQQAVRLSELHLPQQIIYLNLTLLGLIFLVHSNKTIPIKEPKLTFRAQGTKKLTIPKSNFW